MSVAILAQAILVQSLRGSARCPSSQSCEGGLPCLPPAPAASRDGGGLGIHAASASAQSPAEIVGAPVGPPTLLAPGPSGRSHPGPLGSRPVGRGVCFGAGRTLRADSRGLVARLFSAIDGGLLVRYGRAGPGPPHTPGGRVRPAVSDPAAVILQHLREGQLAQQGFQPSGRDASWGKHFKRYPRPLPAPRQRHRHSRPVDIDSVARPCGIQRKKTSHTLLPPPLSPDLPSISL